MKTLRALLPVFLLLSIRTTGYGGTPTAALSLTDVSATATQTGDSTWTLSKTGALDQTTVTWQITATEIPTVAGHLILGGQLTLTNTGSVPRRSATSSSTCRRDPARPG